jgi:hypothetical protein
MIANSIAARLGTLFIAMAGLCLILGSISSKMRANVKLILVSCVIIAAASQISTSNVSTAADRLAVLAALVAAAGLCGILIFKARRRAMFLIFAGVAGWLIALTFKTTINWLFGHWWIVPMALLVPCAAALIAKAWAPGFRDRVHAAQRENSVFQYLLRLLDQLGGASRGARRRHRHIGDIGTTKRSRRGAGPNMI